MITTRHLIDLIWAAKDYEEAERAVAQYEADIRADQARRDVEVSPAITAIIDRWRKLGGRFGTIECPMGIGEYRAGDSLGPTDIVGILIAEIERRAGIGKETSK